MSPRSSRPVPTRTHTRDERSAVALVLVVEGGMHPRVMQLLKDAAGIRVEPTTDLYTALASSATHLSDDPVRAIFVHPNADGFDLAAVPESVRRVDPSIDTVLVADRASADAVAKALELGFEAVLLPPFDGTRVSEVLSALGLGYRGAHEHSALHGASHDAGGQRVVELAIEHAREVARDRDDASALGLDEATARVISLTDPVVSGTRGKAPAASSSPAAAASPEESNALADVLATGRTSSTSRKPPKDVASPPPEPARALGDVDLVRAIRQGNDVVSRAIAIIQQHTGSEDIRFSAPSRGDTPTPPRSERGARSARVGVDHIVFGELLSSTLSEAALNGWAAWLSEWLLLESEHSELDRLAFTDQLTGAGNRRAFERIAVAELQQARAERRQISLVAFDVDDLKLYNDRFGHDAGDAVLRETVEVVRACIRRGDHIFRIGGDEFVVLFCDPSGPRAGGAASPDSVEAVFRRFQDAVREMRLPQIGASGPGTVTISAGLATYPWDGSDLKSLLQHADQLALQSKRSGKNALTLGPAAGENSA